MPRTLEWGWFSPQSIRRCILVPSSQRSCHQQSVITTLGTGGCWQSSWPWMSRGTGWKQPFVVWMDYKNSTSEEYIRSAKWLNSHKARWALYFSRFNFTLTYRPGSKNAKPDAMSRMFQPEGDSHRQYPTPKMCHQGSSLLSGPPVGPFLLTDLSSWGKTRVRRSSISVSGGQPRRRRRRRHQGVSRHMHYLFSEQG